jgi:hypothetical protein
MFFSSGLTHRDDFYRKTYKTGRHCEAATPTKQSMFIITLRSSGWLPAAFRAVAMTIIFADHHSNCASPASMCIKASRTYTIRFPERVPLKICQSADYDFGAGGFSGKSCGQPRLLQPLGRAGAHDGENLCRIPSPLPPPHHPAGMHAKQMPCWRISMPQSQA